MRRPGVIVGFTRERRGDGARAFRWRPLPHRDGEVGIAAQRIFKVHQRRTTTPGPVGPRPSRERGLLLSDGRLGLFRFPTVFLVFASAHSPTFAHALSHPVARVFGLQVN